MELINKKISQEEFQQKSERIMEQISRRFGTAIFLEHNNRRYLLTARHVVFDERRANYNAKNDPKKADPAIYNNTIVNQIFRVLPLDEMEYFVKVNNETLNDDIINATLNYIPKSLFIRNIGPAELRPYTFNKGLDLALISLDRDDVIRPHTDVSSNFADELIKFGYKPISIDDISNEPTQEGAEVFTVGFPGAVARFERLEKLNDLDQVLSPYCSLPNFSFGNVSMLHQHLPYFWVDMSIYPGNSGGPIIENNKLVGIASEQAGIPELGDLIIQSKNIGKTEVNHRIPFGKIIKSKYVFELLQIQEESDKKRDKFNSEVCEMLKKREEQEELKNES